MRALTVIQILPALQSGGVEQGALEVASCLVSQGHRSLVMSAGGRMVAELEAMGSTHFVYPIGRKSLLTFLLIPKLRELWRRERVDVVHVRSRFPAWVVFLAWRGMPRDQRPRLVTTVHGYYRTGWYSRIMTRGERVIVVSNTIEEYVQTAYKVDASKLRLIYRGVDTAQYYLGYQPEMYWQQRWFDEYPQTRGKCLLVLPARITRWKGAEDFVDMLSIVCQQRRDVHALLVGEVADDKQAFAASLKRKIQVLGLADYITFTGYRQDVKQIMAMAKIVYSLSAEPEAFGRTTLEALSLGVPVIGYQHGGVAEQLASMLPEGAVSVGNVAEVAMLTLSWLSHAPTVQANTQFSLQGMQQKTLAVYDDVMTNHEQVG